MTEGNPPGYPPSNQPQQLALQPRPPAPMVSFSDMRAMAEVIAKSRLFGMKTADEALALMVIAQAEGLHPGIVARDYHIIQGRPSLKADTMLARFQQSGGKVEWITLTDQKAEAIWSHPASPRPLTLDWTIERANAVMQWNAKDNKYEPITVKDNWKNYPRAMLRARLISEAVRTVYPAVSVGIYTPEEVMDMGPSIEAQYEVIAEDPRPAAVQGQPTASELPPGRQNRQGDRLASEAQVSFIRTLAQERGIARDQIYAQFKINQSLQEELLASEVDEVIAWLKSFAKLDDSDKLRF